MSPVAYRLPFPPSVNRIWRALGSRVVLSAAARTWKKQAVNALPTGRVVALRGRLRVTLVLCPPAKLRNKAWDVGNREKILCDLLTAQRIWIDDSQIDALHMLRGDCSGEGHVDISIEEIT